MSGSVNSDQFKKSEIEFGIPRRFEAVVENDPENIAIKLPDRSISYHELNQQANRIARTLDSIKGNDDAPVGVYLEHGFTLVTALIGILKAGRMYVVLDVNEPSAQTRSILSAAGISVLLSDTKALCESEFQADTPLHLVKIDDIDAGSPCSNLNLSFNSEKNAAVYYTSGSTGRSKGVLRTHRILLHRAWFDAKDLKLKKHERLALLYNCRFTASSVDIFGALLSGATLCPFDISNSTPQGFIDWVENQCISVLHPPLGYIREILASKPSLNTFNHLRVLSVGGSRLSPSDAHEMYQVLPDSCQIYYRYSGSETSLISSKFLGRNIDLEESVLSVGYPIDDKNVSILDDVGVPVAVGKTGEIAVTSRYLSAGYWGDSSLTNQKFSADATNSDLRTCLTGDVGRLRDDGQLEVLGRKDFMVKIRGYRVEPESIERVLLNVDGVREVVVVPRENDIEDTQLVAYVVCSVNKNSILKPDSLRQAISDKLPSYMVPSRFVFLERMPLTANGKIDRSTLPDPAECTEVGVEGIVVAKSPMEILLAEIWSETLGIAQIGVHDSFLGLGGNSLIALRILTRLQARLDVEIPISAFFSASTIAELSLILESTLKADENENEHKSGEKIGLSSNESFSPFESKLASIWTEVLEIEKIRIHDEFLHLGGDSKQALQILSRVRSEFEVNLESKEFIETSTIADMAILILTQILSEDDLVS